MKKNELELSWIMRLRVTAAIALGICIVGLGGWVFVSPKEPMGVISIAGSGLGILNILLCCVLSLGAGFIASMITVPHGSQIGVLAGPVGMGFWAFKSGAIATAFQIAPATQAREAIYSGLKFEGIAWLAVAAAGWAGAIAAEKIFTKNRTDITRPDNFDPMFKLPDIFVILIAVIGTVFLANKIICAIAQDVTYADSQLGAVFGNPSNAQIALAVLFGFGIAGFLGKLIIGASYIWPALATIPLTYYISTVYGNTEILEYMARSWSAMFFAKPSAAILPIQITAFGGIGAIWGYWAAVRFHMWRHHQH